MSALFLKIVNMSISASWLIAAVLILRLALKRAPKWVSVLLWGVAALRLLIPFSVESALSLIPSAETISPDIMLAPKPQITTGIPALNSVLNPAVARSFATAPEASVNPLQIWISALSAIWAVGAAALLIYALISYLRLRRRVATAVLMRENIFQSENVSSPFVLGVIRPKIYLPFDISDKDSEQVIDHERSHIRRGDHLWKTLGYLILAAHWFNPLVWAAYVLLCRDIELACDERVIKPLTVGQRADYVQALVDCSSGRRSIAACPLAFGEVGVKDRAKFVLNYRKSAAWLKAAAIIVCAAAAVFFLTDPKPSKANVEPLAAGTSYISQKCLYMNPLSSMFGHDSGCRYVIGEDCFEIISRWSVTGTHIPSGQSAAETHAGESIPVSEWEWQDFPYTDSDWSALFVPSSGNETLLRIREIYEDIRYQPLDSGRFLLLADGDLLLVDLNRNDKVGSYIWSVYSLIDEASAAAAG